jgi:hypothetical protein
MTSNSLIDNYMKKAGCHVLMETWGWHRILIKAKSYANSGKIASSSYYNKPLNLFSGTNQYNSLREAVRFYLGPPPLDSSSEEESDSGDDQMNGLSDTETVD